MAFLPIKSKGGVGEEVQFLGVALTHQGEEQIASWTEQNQSRPAGDLQLVPKTRLAVVHHRVADVVAKDGAADIIQDLKVNLNTQH